MRGAVSKTLATLGYAALLLVIAEPVRGAEPSVEELKARLEAFEKQSKAQMERLEKQNRDLLEKLEKLGGGPGPYRADDGKAEKERLQQLIGDYLKERDDKKNAETDAKARSDAAAGYEVGADLALKASWDPRGLLFRSADDAFVLHLGGRLMTDEAWFSQSPNLTKSATQPAGSPLAKITGVGPGIGDLQDGFFVRRARFVADGQVFETLEYKVEFDFENYNSISFDESYIGARNLPLIDTVRVGQMHALLGLEAYTSSRFLPMLERSPLFDAFYNEFAPGIFSNTTFLDQRVTTQHMFHRIDNFNQFNGASFGDGKYAYSGRVSGLPIYADDGRTMLHLGLAYQWRKGSTPADFNGGTTLPSNPTVTTNTDIVRFRTRQGIRDAVGLQGDNNRVVDTGNIIADDVQSVNAELLWYWHSLWVQSEACLAHVDNAVFPASSAGRPRGDLNYYGAYVQVGYFLTGETRGYDKRFGKYDRVRPIDNFFLVKDENGRTQFGLGAWELVYRYAFVNLDDGPIQGGRYSEHTVGLNWYWNSNMKLQCNYINGQRTVPVGAVSGNIQGVGFRAALEF